MMLNRVEEYGDNHIEGKYLQLSFDTKYRGIWQCRWTMTGMDEYASEPPFESLTSGGQTQVKHEARIIFKLTFDKVPNI